MKTFSRQASSSDVNPNSIPASYTLQTSNSITKLINKGQLNKLRIRPAIINEHVESSREVQGVVDSSTIVGQIFKASHDNINSILLTLESAASSVVEDFESYANTTALRVEWVKGGTNEASLETTIVEAGTNSMSMPGTVLNDDWIDTIASSDYTDYTFGIDFYQNNQYLLLKYEFTLSDGVGILSIPLIVDAANEWIHFNIDVNAMTDSGTTDLTAITKIGLRVVDAQNNAIGYVDNITTTPPPGTVGLKLWDMGVTIPVSTTTAIDDGTQYAELGDRGVNGGAVVAEVNLSLRGGKQLYSIKDFVAGVALEIPTNTLLTVDNYYAITINYIDTNVSVYGAESSYSIQYYNNGYAFTAPDEATAITAVGTYNDCMFSIFSTQDVFLNTLVKAYDAAPGSNATDSVFIEDKNMKIVGIISGETLAIQSIQAEFKDRTYPIDKGSKFEIYYNDDFSDSVSASSYLIGYIYEPQLING